MNRQERELARLELSGERAVLKEMQGHYETALERVNERIADLAKRDDLPGVRQRRFQEALAEQIGAALDELRSGSYGTMKRYLEESYEQGFVGTLYNLQKQDIPLAFPIDQQSVSKAVSTTAGDVKLSRRVYSNVDTLQKQVVAEITRGFADAESATQIAGRIASETGIEEGIKRNVEGRTSQAFRRSMTIARTEKGRVRAQATLEAMHKAKGNGADVVKQWDSTMDKRTRPDHVKADGQIRELDEKFVVGGYKGQSPHMMGAASQDVNCRCTCLQRARKALEWDDRSTKWDGVKQCYVNLSDAKSYQEFKVRYTRVVASVSLVTVVPRVYEASLHDMTGQEVAAEATRMDREVNAAWQEYRRDKSVPGYENTMGTYLDALSGDGFLTADRGVKLEGKEVQLAAWLSAKGHDVKFLYASSMKGDHTPDILLDGEPWEMKRVTSGNIGKLKARIDEASRQSDSIMVDLSLSMITSSDAELAIMSMLGDDLIRRIMVIRSGVARLYER